MVKAKSQNKQDARQQLLQVARDIKNKSFNLEPTSTFKVKELKLK